MTFQFPKPFFGGLFVGADAFDSESLAVRNTFGAMFRMTTLWGQVLMFICRFVVYVSWHNTIFTGGVSIQKGDVISRCFMGEFYSGVNIVGVVKETIEVFFRLGPLHVNVVYETKPGKWLVRCRLYDKFFKFPHEDVGVWRCHLCSHSCSVDL